MNPCPCGYFGDRSSRCRCTSEQISRYQNKLSGPLLDRIDMHVTVPPLPAKLLLSQEPIVVESSEIVRARVIKAREIQYERSNTTNAQLIGEAVTTHCQMKASDHRYLENALLKLGLSARAYHRILKLARTIADLNHSDLISQQDLQEALSYRIVKLNEASAPYV